MFEAKGTVVNSWLRQFHRWVSIAFTVTVIANVAARVYATPPSWLTYPPLPPLALLLLTGLYLFALPYRVKWRNVARRLALQFASGSRMLARRRSQTRGVP